MLLTFDEAEHFFTERKKLGIKPGLERIQALLSMLDNPERKMRAIHVAGTNGKGSTIHFIDAVLKANGYHTGIFTSPSFNGILGYIFLNGDVISENDFLDHLNKLYPYIQKLDEENQAPTEFEILTALAYLYFAEKSDVVLIETGMGGRYDTTNTCHPILSIITNVSLDHTEFLGNTVKEIAYHKAGIIKPHIPVIIGEVDQEAKQVILAEVVKQKSHSFRLSDDFMYNYLRKPNVLTWKGEKRELSLSLLMPGDHQMKNVSLALKAIEQLENQDFIINWNKTTAALEQLILPGRFEKLHDNPIVIADAAHNPKGIEAFINTINENQLSKKHVIIAMFQDKDIATMLHMLSTTFEKVTVTTFDHPRAASAEDLNDKNESSNKRINPNWQEAINHQLDGEEAFYITGSLHFITLVREYFVERWTDL